MSAVVPIHRLLLWLIIAMQIGVFLCMKQEWALILAAVWAVALVAAIHAEYQPRGAR